MIAAARGALRRYGFFPMIIGIAFWFSISTPVWIDFG